MNEGYLPLYRKYRPQKLEDVVGQAHIKRALTNAIELNKISHAYLFTGPRGTGKTSTARILAKSLNCINGPTVTPCEECESCKSITNTIPIDVIEIDAASNRSVDDAHEILEKVNYAPVHGKYKIYIIDEVHMLTVQAFNALLKTLEEPPKNVIFILATTESHKVLDTIKSRCQRFDFKRITTNDIVEHLRKIANAENIKITDGALSLIAKSSAGGMRDSLALLDQVSTMGANAEITEDDINSLLGRLSFESLLELSTHIINSDGSAAVTSLEKIYNDGNEPIQILTNLMLFFKNMLISKTCDKKFAIELTGLSEDRLAQLEPLKDALEKHQIVFLINKTADYIKELKETTNQQMWLEVALIDLANLSDNTRLMDLEARISRLEGGEPVQAAPRMPINLQPVKVKEVVETPKVVEQKTETPQPAEEIKKDETVPSEAETQEPVKAPEQSVEKPVNRVQTGDLKSLWSQVLNSLIQDPAGLAIMSAMTSMIQCDEESIVIVANKQSFIDKNFSNPDKKKRLAKAIYSITGLNDVPVIIRERRAEDAEIPKAKLPQKKQSVVPEMTLADEDDIITEDEKKTLDEEQIKGDLQNEGEDSGLSEQGQWIKDIFDGKVLE